MMIEWTQLIVGDEDWDFLIEISVRTLLMYIIILTGLRLLGKRGVKQLSVFEMVVIISLGSAAGDPMFYKEIGLMVPVVIFTIIVGAYKLTTFLMAKNKRIEDLVEGKATYLIEDGEFSISEFKKESLAQDEFFAELRQQGVSHLGQVKTAILETSGNVSIFFFEKEDIKLGLPILPRLFENAIEKIIHSGHYACTFCGNVDEIPAQMAMECERCGHKEWVSAISERRIS
ncbi:DUF421 domain-containing protein [Pedobacter jamesrossensis]|uniref:DUF421 domain-containing protein n=1 Tax=Pedobacter jamesrossensis TaxID=1908238 RepID=A0ABV8NPK4_9SPHI